MDTDLPENSNLQVEEEPSAPVRKSLLFLILAAVWVFPSAGALFIIGGDWAHWFRAATFNQAVQSIALEQWVALGLLLFQLCFVVAAIYYHFHQQPQINE